MDRLMETMREEIVGLIVGFGYSGENVLPGALNDVQQIYSWMISIGCQDIYVISDFHFLENLDLRQQKFLELIKDRHYFYDGNFLFFIEQIVRCRKRVIFYYTGHAQNKYLLCPQKSFGKCDSHWLNSTKSISAECDKEFYAIEIDKLNRIFERRLNCLRDANGELIAIFDCCNGLEMNLPFEQKSRYVSYRDSLDCFFRTSAVCLSSSEIGEKAIMKDTGSFFTQSLLEILKKGSEINSWRKFLDLLIEKMRGINQTPHIYFSYPMMKIFPWIFAGK
jgi:hypothetical protein